MRALSLRYAPWSVAVLSLLVTVVSPDTTLAAPPADRLTRIGVISSGPPERTAIIENAVTAGLSEQGYVEGKNLMVVRRFAHVRTDPMDVYIDELVGMKLDAIITGCGWSTRVAMKATQTTPIVMVSVSNPVTRGFIKSIARPGANVTGVSGTVAGLSAKMLDHMRLALPEVKIVGVLMNAKSEAHQATFREMESAAPSLGIRLAAIGLHQLETPQAAREAFRRAGAQGLLVLPDDDTVFFTVDRILVASDDLRLPAFFFRRDFLDLGGFISYGADAYDLFRKTGSYVDKIVNGANPADLPVEQPTRLELAVNLKKAAAYGITIPRSVLMRADTILK